MLTIYVPELEYFDESSSEFITFDSVELQLEHSLVSVSKWESIHEKPFLDKKEKTTAEVHSYIRCMIFSPEDPPDKVEERLSDADYSAINQYLERKMSATWFSDRKGPPNREVITSELIYYWMVALNIPFECQYWHLNRLMTLIQVCNVKNQPKKKQSKAEIIARNRELNAQRRAQFGTRG